MTNVIRRISIFGRIDRNGPVNLGNVRRQLRLDEPMPDRVVLEIDSEGGIVNEAEKIFALLRSLPCPVEAVVQAKCLSAAIDILIAADLRLCHRESRFLLHSTAAYLDDEQGRLTAPVLERRAAHLRRADEHFADILALRTGHPRDWFVQEMVSETEIESLEATHVGLVHGVVGGMRPYREWPEELRLIRSNRRLIGIPAHLTRAPFLKACELSPSSTELVRAVTN